MLRVENLTKIYKTKKGADVYALDGVTLQFPEKGMVFLLGKSGSGKSTLLNVCGGLDAPTSGEIIVKGRSSKDFSQADFDSYRNTFIGFIFQEYNILNEFSVEDNIALALELQGKSKDKKAIKELLEQVDLQGFAKRKPNTLSGGQKQRIAIARALIKSPEIIMADEPTGALDSNTGRQVLETLKKLSQQKLVIIVSHDREFAELYGDRIIELKDGKVISDVTKGTVGEEALSENINTIGDVLCIKNGNTLTDSEFEKIKAFLKKCKNDIIIAKDETDVKNFKKVNRINDDGQKEIFADTDESKISKKEYTKEESRFIRSRLPMRHAFKIGVSSLRLKPIRLLFTVLLCTVAFTLLGLLSTLNFYDSEATFKETLSDISISNIQLHKEYETLNIWYERGEKRNEYEAWERGKFNSAEIKELGDKLGRDAFGGLSIGGSFNLRVNNSKYWQNNIVAFANLPQNNSLRQKITGTYPQNNDEILITSYIADMFIQCQAVDSNSNLIEVSDRSQLIGKKISIQGEVFKITGILDTGEVPADYESLKTATEEDYNLQNKMRSYFESSLHGIVFTTEERIQKFAAQNENYKESLTNYTRVVAALKVGGKYNYPEYANANYVRPSDIGNSYKLYSPDGVTTPANNQALVTNELFGQMASESYWKLIEEADQNGNYELAEKYRKVAEIADQVRMGGIYKWDEATKTDSFTQLNDAQIKAKVNELFKAMKRDSVSLKLGVKAYDDQNQSAKGTQNELSIVGVAYKSVLSEHGGETKIVVSEATFNKLWDEQKTFVEYYGESKTDYVEPENAAFTTAIIPFSYDEAVVNEYWSIYNNKEFDQKFTRLGISSSFIYNLQMVDDMVDGLSKVFLYVGLVFALFAALLLSNFISVSISNKKREIGILRAVGARGTDVFKIFFSESFTITAICIVLSTIFSIIVCGLINGETVNYIGASLFVFGILSFIIMVLIALVTAIIATFLPVYNAAKKKPVDSNRSL